MIVEWNDKICQQIFCQSVKFQDVNGKNLLPINGNPPQTHRWPTEQGHSPHVTSSIIQFNSINYSFVSNIPWERAKWRLSIIIMTIIYIYIFIYIHIYSYIFIYIIYIYYMYIYTYIQRPYITL